MRGISEVCGCDKQLFRVNQHALGIMPGLVAHDAEMRLLNASEAISARKSDDSQEKWKELLVCTVERGGQAKNKRNLPKVEAIGLSWATFQVMRRTFATWAKKAGVDAHTRSAQMGNTVDVNENEYAVATFEQKLAAVRKLETAVVQ